MSERDRKRGLRVWVVRSLKAAAGVVAVLAVAGVVLWNWPTGFFAVSTWLVRTLSGTELRFVDVGGDSTPTLFARGDADDPDAHTAVLLLHGWGTSKEAMLTQLAWLGQTRMAFAPDLPGFGEHPLRSDQAALTGDEYVAWIDKFIRAVGCERVDLIGESMGGALAAAYAAEHPERVRRLVLEAPAGVRAPTQNEFMRRVESGENPLRIADEADFDRVVSLVFERPPPIPYPIRKYLVERAQRDLPRQGEMVEAMRGFLLAGNEVRLARIAAPTLVMFGANDRVTDPSMLDVYAAAIRDSRRVLVPGAGHVIFHDAPLAVAREIRVLLDP
jgi:pimeloyl-ACP methyl ester carboxylesterase